MAKPLTKQKRTGERYTRPKSIENHIDGALREDTAGLRRRLSVTDAESADYLKSECLVHLIRELTRRGEIELRNALVMALLGRCDIILKSKIDPGQIRNADSLRETILSEFALVLAGDGESEHELDYFECRFNAAFRSFRIDILRSERRASSHVALPTEVASADEDDEGSGPDVPSCPAEQENDFAMAEMLDKLPPDERNAVVLVRIMGYEVESTDPTKRTAATICNVSGRTIRQRLQRAREILSPFYEEKI